MSSVGDFYDSSGVIVGQAIGFIAPPNTPLPSDLIGSAWDLATWAGDSVTVGAASAGNFTLTLSGGPLAAPLTTANIAWNATSTAVAAAIQAVLPSSLTAVVSGTAPTWKVAIDGTAGADIIVSGSGVGLTGGAFAVTLNPWIPAGATEQGWQVNYNQSTQDINIEEQPTPVQRQVTTAQFQFVANLAEDTVQSLQWALSATATIQAPDTTHVGKTTLQMQPTLPQYAVALETTNKYGLIRRYYVPRATGAGNVGQTFRRAAASRMVPITFGSVCNLNEILIVDVSANHT